MFHVTDDVLLLAQTAIGLAAGARARHAAGGRGRRPNSAGQPAVITSFASPSWTTGKNGRRSWPKPPPRDRLRDFFGFNRARHAVLEAAILATRTEILPLDEMLADFRKLAVLVDKTGGPRERAAFTLLHRHVHDAAVRQGLTPDPGRPPTL